MPSFGSAPSGGLLSACIEELCEQGADIAVGIDNVCCLGKTNVTDLELGKLLRVVKIDVIDDREGAPDGVSQATTAGFIETGGETIDDSEEQELPVLSCVFDSLFGTSNINYFGNFGRNFIREFLLESEVLGSPTDGSQVRTSGALMII